jgi:hypothetical protein
MGIASGGHDLQQELQAFRTQIDADRNAHWGGDD